MPNITKAVDYMVKIAKDDTHGYDQTFRYGTPDYDCSSLIARALVEAGFNVKLNSWTGNLYEQLTDQGFYALPINYQRLAGDIFLNINHHVIMCTSPEFVVYASINENGGTRGGKAGDQTGEEIKVARFYTPSYGWHYHLRYHPSKSVIAKQVINGEWGKDYERIGRLYSCGYDPNEIQHEVNKILGV